MADSSRIPPKDSPAPERPKASRAGAHSKWSAPSSTGLSLYSTPLPAGVAQFEEAIREQEGCVCHYRRTVFVREPFLTAPNWDGFVYIFELVEHPKAHCAFAWSYLKDGQKQCMIVAGDPTIDSPEDALRAANARILGHHAP
jgi:hypothetical protein